MSTKNKSEFTLAIPHGNLTTGKMIRILREKKEWTQAELARRTGIGITNLSLLEHDRIDIGKKRAERLAKAFGLHPVSILYPGYWYTEICKAA